MYINPFIAGIFATLFFEALAILVLAFYYGGKNDE